MTNSTTNKIETFVIGTYNGNKLVNEYEYVGTYIQALRIALDGDDFSSVNTIEGMISEFIILRDALVDDAEGVDDLNNRIEIIRDLLTVTGYNKDSVVIMYQVGREFVVHDIALYATDCRVNKK